MLSFECSTLSLSGKCLVPLCVNSMVFISVDFFIVCHTRGHHTGIPNSMTKASMFVFIIMYFIFSLYNGARRCRFPTAPHSPVSDGTDCNPVGRYRRTAVCPLRPSIPGPIMTLTSSIRPTREIRRRYARRQRQPDAPRRTLSQKYFHSTPKVYVSFAGCYP